MQRKDAEIQAQQVGMTQGRPQRLARHARFTMLQMALCARQGGDDDAPQQRQSRRQPEQCGQAERLGHQRTDHHGDGERQTDAHADHRHGLGAVLLAGQVGEQRHHRRGNRPGALQYAAGDHPPDTVGHGRQHRTGGEDQQAEIDDRQTADAIGKNAEGNLQQRLGQTIGADGKADQRRRRSLQIHPIGRQHRQHHEHAEHAKREDQGQPGSRTGFAGAHALAVGVLHLGVSLE